MKSSYEIIMEYNYKLAKNRKFSYINYFFLNKFFAI